MGQKPSPRGRLSGAGALSRARSGDSDPLLMFNIPRSSLLTFLSFRALIGLGLLVLILLGFMAFGQFALAYTLGLVFFYVLGCVGLVAVFAAAFGYLHVHLKDFNTELAASLFQGYKTALVVTDERGIVLHSNDAYQRLTSDQGEGFVQPDRLFSFDPQIVQSLYQMLRIALESGQCIREFRSDVPFSLVFDENDLSYDPKATRSKWLMFRIERISGHSLSAKSALRGGHFHYLWSITDITSERFQQEVIFKELQTAIDYLDQAPAGFLAVGMDQSILYANATFADWLGRDLGTLSDAQTRLDMLLPEDASELIEAVQAPDGAIENGSVFDIDFVHRSGKRVPVRVLFKREKSFSGEPLSRLVILDRSDKSMVADSDVNSAELKFARFFNNAPIAITTIDSEGCFKRGNNGFTRLINRLSETSDCIDVSKEMRILDLIVADDRAQLAHLLQKAHDGEAVIGSVDVTFVGTPSSFGRFYVAPVSGFSEEGEVAIVYAMDITEQKALEQQFVQSQKMQAIGQLAGGIAHDFNNMLTAIIGFSDLLISTRKKSDPSYQDLMKIKSNAERAAGLVKQLLAFSRRQTMRPEKVDLNAILSDLRVMLDRLMGDQVYLKVDYTQGLWPVYVDKTQIDQVVMNLVINARDAMPLGGEVRVTSQNITSDSVSKFSYKGLIEQDYVLIEVVDTGTGIAPEHLDKIFDPFFSTKDVGKGTGLGLSTVYGIVKQTGGFIYCDSVVGEGTTFRIFLPREMAVEQPEALVQEIEAPQASKPVDLTGDGKILIVEDEDEVRAVAERALSAKGYTVLTATTGVEGLEVLEEEGNDIMLILSDVVMPEMDGPTLFKNVRKTHPDLKFVFMSGYAEDAFRKTLDGTEDFGFIPKPFTLKKLAEKVKQVLEGA